MKQTEIHEKAIRLIEGGVAEVDGHFVVARIAMNQTFPCEGCNMDSICTRDSNAIMDVCMECDRLTNTKHVLRIKGTVR